MRTSRPSRQERNMLRDVEGKTVADDAEIMSKVMALV